MDWRFAGALVLAGVLWVAEICARNIFKCPKVS
jgi:hypothetical protein